MTLWVERIIGGDGAEQRGVRLEVDTAGRISSRSTAEARSGDLTLGTVMAGPGNAHSHLFHRVLRGRTQGFGGDFWRWREVMYRTAASLEPDDYFELASAVFAEMLVCGYTAVGEFHYLHHRADGSPYPHEFELAVVAAAAAVGIRLRLLDTAYLAGGIGEALDGVQRRFGDRDADAYLERWYRLRERIPSLGAALHSVRAVPAAALARIVDGLPADVPIHIHLSEQRQENLDCVAAHGVTPAQLLADHGVLSPRVSVVHATHLTDDDIALLGRKGVSTVICPTTEADLGDGIGPARRLADAGSVIALGSDQNAVIDPFLEMRGLEMHERLAGQARGRFSPAALGEAATGGSYRSLGFGSHALETGDACDLIEVDPASLRTVGSLSSQLILTATAADVRRVVVGGHIVADGGVLHDGRRPLDMLASALRATTW